VAFTFFMRDQQTIERAAEQMIPYASGRSRIKIWNAGCAMGQETYTVAMLFAERMNQFGFKNLRIDASDHDSANNVGDIVTSATYNYEELKRTPAELFEKYFEPAAEPGFHRVKESLRSRVHFQYHDLLSLRPFGHDYCLIICKNVLLHFNYKQRIQVIRMFHDALAPGGYFVCENTQKMPPELSHLFRQVVADAQLFKKG